MSFFNPPAPRVQPCSSCGKPREVAGYRGDNPTKPLCKRCLPILAMVEKFRILNLVEGVR